MNEDPSEFRRLSIEETVNLLLPVCDTLILVHVHPDGDTIGSAFALRELLRQSGSRAWCVGADELPNRLAFIAQGAQNSILPESIPKDFDVHRIISTDVASPAQLGSLYVRFGDCINLMIDHHEKGEAFADNLIYPGCAATGEIIFDIAKNMPCGITPVAAMLYAAISSDTGCFRFSNTTPETHICAAELLAFGIDSAYINHRLFEVKSKIQMAVEGKAMERIEYFLDGKLAVITFPNDLIKSLGADSQHLETVIDIARSAEGVEVAVAIRQPDESQVFRVSMRSSVDFDVSAVCAEFGGGGHVRAAGCTLHCDGIDAAKSAIVGSVTRKYSTDKNFF